MTSKQMRCIMITKKGSKLAGSSVKLFSKEQQESSKRRSHSRQNTTLPDVLLLHIFVWRTSHGTTRS